MTLAKKQCVLDIRKLSFSRRIVNEWNRSANCVGASSVNMFKIKSTGPLSHSCLGQTGQYREQYSVGAGQIIAHYRILLPSHEIITRRRSHAAV